MLDKVPPEVLGLIAFHLTLPTLRPPVNLLLASRTIHDVISPKANPLLYAKVFRQTFDMEAVERRIGEIKPLAVTSELRRRVMVLFRLRQMVDRSDLSDLRDDDLWVVYLMLIENGT